ncbi:MAG TPA: hypothetical protein VMM12_03805 [Longimicrobiales bacterium]|nr:hypothetical protein [Longimicrobiales bacterium]
MPGSRLSLGLLILALALLPGRGHAQIVLAEGDGVRLGLSGYLRSLTGLHDLGYAAPGAERRSGFHGEVVRLKWRLEAGRFGLDVHNRLQARVTSGGADGPALGFGVSAIPGRSVDLSSDLLSAPGLRVWHDIDRLSLSLRTSLADITLGRQPITWGISSLFPVADLWAAFSPFELDTEEKPGVDAARALFYPAEGLEMDAVVADRGSPEHLSAGIRATWGLPSADVWAGAGKLWDQAMLMGGATLLFDAARLQTVFPFDRRPRATLGVDWIRGRGSVTGEAHYNGTGVPDPAEYVQQLQDPAFRRGESYFLGRYYLGAAGAWAPDEAGRVRLALSALVNAGDGSAALTPILDYDLGPATSVSLGGLVSFGESPAVALPPSLRSEFGAYGDLFFTRVSVYF